MSARDRRDVRGREAVPANSYLAASEPGDVEIDPTCEELDRRRRVVEELERVGALMAPDRDHGGESPRVALDGQVVRGGDQHRLAEIRLVGDLVQRLGELLLRRREAHVDHVESLLDRPPETSEERRPTAREPGAQDTHADQAAFRGESANDPGAGGPVAAEVSLLILLDDELSGLGDCDGDGPIDLSHERVVRLDTAVDDAHGGPLAGRAPERPLTVDAIGPLQRNRNSIDCVPRQAPGRKLLFALVRNDGGVGFHRIILASKHVGWKNGPRSPTAAWREC